MASRRRITSDHRKITTLLDACDRLEERSLQVLGWAQTGTSHTPTPPARIAPEPGPGPAPAAGTAPAPAPDSTPVPAERERAERERAAPRPGPRLEAELTPVVERWLQERGLVAGREFSVYPSRASRRRTVADLVGVAPQPRAVRARMKLERRRVTLAEFWPALLQCLELAPAEPFRRAELLARLDEHPVTRDMPAARLSRYLRTLRRYGYLRRVDRIRYVRRSPYLEVAAAERTAAVELKRHSFRAGLAQAISYARVVPVVWIAAGSAWPDDPDLTQRLHRFGIGALEVHGQRVRQRVAPVPGLALDPRFAAYRQVLEERVVREQVLGRPRAFA